MRTPSVIGETQSYPSQLFALASQSVAQLLSPPIAPHRQEAVRRWRRQSLWLLTIGAALVVILMLGFDAAEISLMPPRKSPNVWPARFITDFGKDDYVLMALAAVLVVMALVFPLLRGGARTRLLRLASHVEYLLLAVALPLAFAQVIKYVVGRGRPFVGGEANPFNFVPFKGTEAYFSFPSAHSVAVFALAFGIAAIWPRWRVPILIYALLIGASRLVLLAHHPSDVAGGAVIGLLGALAMRTWFAVREVGFVIEADGKVVAR
jgi:undecaprenyl-diphosphatase